MVRKFLKYLIMNSRSEESLHKLASLLIKSRIFEDFEEKN
jgi:hypothetical protein